MKPFMGTVELLCGVLVKIRDAGLLKIVGSNKTTDDARRIAWLLLRARGWPGSMILTQCGMTAKEMDERRKEHEHDLG